VSFEDDLMELKKQGIDIKKRTGCRGRVKASLKRKLYNKTLKFFNDDKVKTDLWWKTNNLNFGGISPNDLWNINAVKLSVFINCRLDENERKSSHSGAGEK